MTTHSEPHAIYRNAQTGCEVYVWQEGIQYTAQLVNPMGFATWIVSVGTDLVAMLRDLATIVHDSWIAPYAEEETEPADAITGRFRAVLRDVDSAGNAISPAIIREFSSYAAAENWFDLAVFQGLGNAGSIHEHVPGIGWVLAD